MHTETNKTTKTMFTILTKIVIDNEGNKNTFDRYFHDWNNAQEVMDKEVNQHIKEGATLLKSVDRMNVAKGFYEYEKILEKKYENGEVFNFTYALIDAYFADEE